MDIDFHAVMPKCGFPYELELADQARFVSFPKKIQKPR